MNRRGFLQIIGAAIAAPVIARAAIIPDLILPPGITRVPEITKPMLARGDARFATAVFTPGGEIRAIADALKARIPLPAGTFYQIRALQLSAAELGRHVGRAAFNRGGWAVMWVTDASMQRGEHPHLAGSELLGTYRAGDQYSWVRDDAGLLPVHGGHTDVWEVPREAWDAVDWPASWQTPSWKKPR